MADFLLQEESYKIIGKCIEVHNQLGAGFLEIVYKDALEWEFKNQKIPFEREKEYLVNHKETILPHRFFADFVVLGEIILEVKAASGIFDAFIAQAMNYLKVSGNRLALIINFGTTSMGIKRVIM